MYTPKHSSLPYVRVDVCCHYRFSNSPTVRSSSVRPRSRRRASSAFTMARTARADRSSASACAFRNAAISAECAALTRSIVSACSLSMRARSTASASAVAELAAAGAAAGAAATTTAGAAAAATTGSVAGTGSSGGDSVGALASATAAVVGIVGAAGGAASTAAGVGGAAETPPEVQTLHRRPSPAFHCFLLNPAFSLDEPQAEQTRAGIRLARAVAVH